LWGLRGGGGNFGVVTSFTSRLHPVPVPIYAGMVVHPLERAREEMRVFFDLAADAPDEFVTAAAK
jgi:FAD/FMN-containing dehydrogenase